MKQILLLLIATIVLVQGYEFQWCRQSLMDGHTDPSCLKMGNLIAVLDQVHAREQYGPFEQYSRNISLSVYHSSHYYVMDFYYLWDLILQKVCYAHELHGIVCLFDGRMAKCKYFPGEFREYMCRESFRGSCFFDLWWPEDGAGDIYESRAIEYYMYRCTDFTHHSIDDDDDDYE